MPHNKIEQIKTIKYTPQKQQNQPKRNIYTCYITYIINTILCILNIGLDEEINN